MDKEPLDIHHCKHFKDEMRALLVDCKALYQLPGCSAGGMLHILLDDNNIDDDDILYCLKDCLRHPEKPESVLGVNICLAYLKMEIAERRVFDLYWCGAETLICGDCTECYFELGYDY